MTGPTEGVRREPAAPILPSLHGPADLRGLTDAQLADFPPSPLREKLVNGGIDPILSTPAEMSRTLRSEREQLQAIVKSIGFKKD
jgi:hypothetical protein